MVFTPVAPGHTTIQGEPAVPLDAMPSSWQHIANGDWMSEP
ncbi:MAG: hypothetical protein ACFB2W_09075 [Leptolyngbyaceae cyanobacterium]